MSLAGLPDYNRSSYVTDLAGLLNNDEQAALDAKIRVFEKMTSIEIAVATVPSLDGMEIEDYGNQLFRKWGIGKAGENNGLLILVAPNERKWRIEVGYGLEEWITDGGSSADANRLLKPNFRQKNYFAGLDGLLDVFITQLGNSTWAQRITDKQTREADRAKSQANVLSAILWILGILGFGGIIAFFFVRQVRKNRKAEEERKATKARIDRMRTAIINSPDKMGNIYNKLVQLSSSKYVGAEAKLMADSANTAKAKLVDTVGFCNESILESKLTEMYEATLSSLKYHENKMNEIDANDKICVEIGGHYPSFVSTIATVRRNSQVVSEKLKTINSEGSKYSTYKSVTVDTETPLKSAESYSQKAIDALSKSVGDAIMFYNKSKEYIVLATNAINYANNHVSNFETAKTYVLGARKQMDNLLSDAERECRDSDVTSYTRSSLTTVKATITSVKHRLDGGMDPIAAKSLVDSTIASINEVIRKARRNKSDAADERDREQRRTEAAAAAVIFSSSDSYSSSSSSSSDSSSSFGGGDSGGGGSSGDW